MISGFNEDQIKAWIKDQVDLGPRRPGSPAGHLQENDLEKKLLSFGCTSVRKEPVDVEHWEPGICTLDITGSSSSAINCFPIPHAAFTSEGLNNSVEGPLVWAEDRHWRRTDWKGAIVIAEIRFPMLDAKLLRRISLGEVDQEDTLKNVQHPATWIRLGWHLYRRAVQKGAAGFVGILRDQPGGSCRMYAPYGFREKNILDKPLPGVWASRDDGEYLKKLCFEKNSRGRLFTSGVRQQSVSHNVIGEIAGATEETMIVTCHHDSPFRSPVEDASGIAVVLAIAQYFAGAAVLKRRLIVVLTAGHFYGSVGTRTFISDHRSDVLPDTVFALSIEHIAREAVEDPGGRLVPSGRSEAAGIFLSFNKILRDGLLKVTSRSGLDRLILLPAEGPLGNYPPTDGGDWYEAGIPIVNFISNPVYLLTDDDADHWVDGGNLVPVARVFTDLLLLIDGVPRQNLERCDFPVRRAIMKILRFIMQAKTTRFGRTPVH